MINLPDKFYVPFSRKHLDDVATTLRRMRTQGLLGPFLCDEQVLGDEVCDPLRSFGGEMVFHYYASRLSNGEGLIISAEGDCVPLSLPGESKPPDAGVPEPVETFHVTYIPPDPFEIK